MARAFQARIGPTTHSASLLTMATPRPASIAASAKRAPASESPVASTMISIGSAMRSSTERQIAIASVVNAFSAAARSSQRSTSNPAARSDASTRSESRSATARMVKPFHTAGLRDQRHAEFAATYQARRRLVSRVPEQTRSRTASCCTSYWMRLAKHQKPPIRDAGLRGARIDRGESRWSRCRRATGPQKPEQRRKRRKRPEALSWRAEYAPHQSRTVAGRRVDHELSQGDVHDCDHP